MNLEQLVKGQLSDQAIKVFAQKLGVNTTKAEELVDALTPLLTGALANNASTPSGAESLNTALEKDHSGDLLSNLTSILAQGGTADASKILEHVFGSKKESVEIGAAAATGESPSTVNTALQMLGPIVLETLGKIKQEQGLSVEDLTQVLQTNKQNMNVNSLGAQLLNMLFDKNNDGDIKDDLLNMLLKKARSFFTK